jgi:hypothetical protein
MAENKIEIGDIVTYCLGILPSTVYRYIAEQKHGIALCEDKQGDRWRFSYAALIPATEEQIKEFNKTT